MLVAIIKNGAGVVRVEEFRDAVDEAAAVIEFCDEYTPPKNPADYTGFDTGWSEVQQPDNGYFWAYDFNSPGLVQELLPETDRFFALMLIQVVSDPKSDPSGGTTPYDWEDMGLLSVNLDFMFSDMSKAQLRIWGQHKTHQEGANVPQIRLAAGGAAYSDEIDLPDTSGSWVNFSFNTIGYTLPDGRTLFIVQTKLRNALSTIDLRAVSIAILKHI